MSAVIKWYHSTGGDPVKTALVVGSPILTNNMDRSHRWRVFGQNLAFPTLASTVSLLLAVVLLDHVGWRGSLSLRGVVTVSMIPALFITEARKPTDSWNGMG